jgi:hypothetical protein
MALLEPEGSPVKPILMIAVLGVGFAPLSTADDKFTCPVTKPTPITFDPSGVFAGDQRGNLFGNEKLFTIFPGNWQTTQQRERGYRVPKIVWGSETFDLRQEWEKSTLTITGRRLDATSVTLDFRGAHTARVDKGYFITSEFYVPSLGCWEVIGHFHGADLMIVVDLK